MTQTTIHVNQNSFSYYQIVSPTINSPFSHRKALIWLQKKNLKKQHIELPYKIPKHTRMSKKLEKSFNKFFTNKKIVID